MLYNVYVNHIHCYALCCMKAVYLITVIKYKLRMSVYIYVYYNRNNVILKCLNISILLTAYVCVYILCMISMFICFIFYKIMFNIKHKHH